MPGQIHNRSYVTIPTDNQLSSQDFENIIRQIKEQPLLTPAKLAAEWGLTRNRATDILNKYQN